MEQTPLPFQNLSARHPGVTDAVGSAFAEAARVCLDRHHISPIEISIDGTEARCEAMAQWKRADERTRGAWANEIDTTEAGAYGIALAGIEIAEAMVAVRRAETRTGADYYIAPRGSSAEDLVAWLRLEVSGVDRGNDLTVKQRLREKIRQALDGDSNRPAFAAVVGFRAKLIAVARAEAS